MGMALVAMLVSQDTRDVEILKVVYDGEKEKVINLWEKKKKEIFGGKKLKPLEILELARKVFHEDNVKDKALLEAAATCRVETVKELLNDGTNPNARDDRGETPLHWAIGAQRMCKGLL